MLDRFSRWVGFQVSLGHVGLTITFADKDMIPRLVFGRPSSGYRFIPFFHARENRIYVYYHSTIAKKAMANKLANVEPSFLFYHFTLVYFPFSGLWFFVRAVFFCKALYLITI